MSERVRLERLATNARIWEPVISAWRETAEDDDEVVMITDIVPTGFSDAALAAGQAHRGAPEWVWRKV